MGRVDFELDKEEVREMRKYLPPLRLVDQGLRVAPTSFCPKKKEPLIVDPSF